ncbi:MAG: hypothetical protein ACM3S1_10490 [Hyphomicrobiales bacterium]
MAHRGETVVGGYPGSPFEGKRGVVTPSLSSRGTSLSWIRASTTAQGGRRGSLALRGARDRRCELDFAAHLHHMNIGKVTGGTRAGWKRQREKPRDWKCPSCGTHLRYFWPACPNDNTRRPDPQEV